ncbi:Hypothetical protein, putative [Bodo saltans]|uniref:Uncharacterized protein n=1 Tax=Bodo saltans TaxID=75058 RepID=A0A0S4JM90_BODSA|nr:Hypothetical protein, putative [Bodo saltans]|eukprot:CUG89609.1 Hypothetical protein, putative [Bodo saltans]
MRSAEGMIRDMTVIGLSGVRLTGDMEHELQYPTTTKAKETYQHISKDTNRGSVSYSAGSGETGGRGAGFHLSQTSPKLCASAARSAAASSFWGSATVRGDVSWTGGHRNQPKSDVHTYPTAAKVPVITDTDTVSATIVKPTLEQILCAENHTLSNFGVFPVPTLDDLRLPLPDYAHDDHVGRDLFGASSTKTHRLSFQTSLHSSADDSTASVVHQHRPMSARVNPSVRQLRVYAAPLYPNIPVAPHLTAVLRWCRNAQELRVNAHIRHLLRIADHTNSEGEKSSELQVGWELAAGDGGSGFFVAGQRDGSSSPPNPSSSTVQSLGSAQTPAPQRKSIQYIIRNSKFTMNIVREATHGIFEDHISWYHAIVAVWFEFCNKDVASAPNKYRIPGCMGNSASAFVSFFETLFATVHLGPNDADQMYQLLNDDSLEQLTFGKCFLLLYLILGPERVNPVDMPHANTIPLNEKTRSKEELVALRKKRLSLVGSDNQLGNTLFANTAIPADRATQIDEKRRASATPFSAMFPTRFPSIAELWLSLAGALILRKCRTVNVFHVESVVTTVLSIILAGVESNATSQAEHHAARVRSVEATLREDLRKFQEVIGSRVEVMQEEALTILNQHTKVLGKWLISTCAQDAQQELNAIVECVLQTMAEEEKIELQLVASMKAQAAAAPPARKKRGGPPVRSNSLMLPPKRKLSIGVELGKTVGRSPTPL